MGLEEASKKVDKDDNSEFCQLVAAGLIDRANSQNIASGIVETDSRAGEPAIMRFDEN